MDSTFSADNHSTNSSDHETYIKNLETMCVDENNNSSSIFPLSVDIPYCMTCTTPPHIPNESPPCKVPLFKEIFDSGCNFCISGSPNRLQHLIDRRQQNQLPHGVMGFNGTSSSITATGINAYGLQEHYIEGMPKDLCLLCAQQFAKQGAAILFGDCGYVLRLDSNQLQQLNPIDTR